MDEAVDVLFADALALGLGAAVGIDVIPPGASFVVAEGLADQFAHGAAFFLCDGLGALQHIGRKGYGERSGVPHGDIVSQDFARFRVILVAVVSVCGARGGPALRVLCGSLSGTTGSRALPGFARGE